MGKLSKKEYEELLLPMQQELVAMARWVIATNARVVVVLEGRDTAGKGGVIRAIADRLNPRNCRVVALPKASDVEKTQWYFQRYIQHLPSAGEIVLFDRSWYNRAGVERVMGFATEEEVDSFLYQCPAFEKLLIDDGVLLFKYWLSCDQEQQEERFRERLEDPLKRWKLSPIDLSAREKYHDYTMARSAMLAATHKPSAPWTLVDFNDQRVGRLTLIRHFLDRMPDSWVEPREIDLPPLSVKLEKEEFGVLKPIKPYKA
ncbi:MAG: polyphosphate kinase 2 [Novosphingobium sp.]